MANYFISPLAYLKVILHASKFPYATVTGLLLGTQTAGVVTISDAVPLLHHWTDLSPMMEAGLQLAEIHARSQGQVFVGLYVGNKGLEETGIPATSVKVADALRREFPEAIVLVVDNLKLAGDSPALIPYLTSSPSSSWTPSPLPSPRITLSDPSIPAKALAQVAAGKHTLLGDFDDHLEDVTVDWLVNARVAV